ncbi:sensor histidine kinase [Azorhizobium doebereinerae]|uniref:sensor histidine kinase n=1 Tax=Azorhizobium doebereinerae TaxID=281091 RepID=UPI0004172A3A|nr:ATP-binding protein [Azorhizobium doebereinerae]
MSQAPPFRWWARLALRPKLALAFLAVSVPPVLIASFIAAQSISAAFEHNVAQWIGEIAMFMANEAVEAQEEAQHATSIVAAAIAGAKLDPNGEVGPIETFADLLTSVGYDYMRLYDADGRILFSIGDLELTQPLPREAMSSIFFGQDHDEPVMMVGAVQELRIAGADSFLFVGNLLDEKFFNAPETIRSLDVHLLEVSADGRVVRDLTRGRGGAFTVPPTVLAHLLDGAETADQNGLRVKSAVAYAALRDNRHRLVGIVVCRLNGTSATFERLGTWWLFLALAGVAGLLSLLAGIGLSQRLSEPLRQLMLGLRSVAAGDYHMRIPEVGGREMEELAVGFNAMTAQLEALRTLEAEMRHRAQLATLGEAAAVIAHEIRNPLGIIKTSTELVRRKSALAPGNDRLMVFVLEEVNRIERLVAELLDYVHPAHCQRRPIDLVGEVAQPALDFTAPELKRRGITYALLAPAAPAMVMGDPDRLHQSLLNLILNAADAVGEGGHIILRVTLSGGMVSLEVEDNGPGVPPDMVARMFDPFVTSKANGTGLGLAKVQVTLEAHDGSIEYRRAPEGGAIFRIRLPLVRDKEG